MTLWPWIAASVVIHGLIVAGLYISWPDDEKFHADGFVTIELIQAMPKMAFETNTKTVVDSHAYLSKNVESIFREVIKTEPKSAQKVATVTAVPNTETDKQMAAKPEKKASAALYALSQERMEAEQAQSERKWKRVLARLEESKWYPSSARRRGIEGDVELGFSLNKEGYAKYTSILAGSGYAMLDQAALETVKRAEPFPADGGEYRFKLRFR